MKKIKQDVVVVDAFKGFNKDLTCRGFKYEIGNTYEHEGEVKACNGGFHACESPIDVFNYYPPAESRYATVQLDTDQRPVQLDTNQLVLLQDATERLWQKRVAQCFWLSATTIGILFTFGLELLVKMVFCQKHGTRLPMAFWSPFN